MNAVKLRNGNEKLRIVSINDRHVVLVPSCNFKRLHPHEAANAMVDVHDKISGLQIGITLQTLRIAHGLMSWLAFFDFCEKFIFRQHDQMA